jgi:RimJ/RimL family protein N-acetyltransferase
LNLCLDSGRVGAWVTDKTGGSWVAEQGTAIGKLVNNELCAGVLYENYNKANIVCHIAGEGAWACREYLATIFHYPFVQLGVKRITVPVNDSNVKSIGLVEKMGFIMEAKLAQATPDGDLLIYRLFRDECKYIKGKYGQVFSTSAT